MVQSLRNAIGLKVPAICMLAMFITACATTELTSTWKDSSYEGHPSRVMVIGVSKNPINRRIFEEEFVQQIKAHGVDAIASYTVLPDANQNDPDAIEKKVREQQVDSVLITRLVSKKTVQVYVPGTVYYPPIYYGTWPDYYGFGYQAIYTPGYVAEDEYAFAETNLYDASNQKLVWAASSETRMRGPDQKLIKEYVGVIVKAMVKQDLLGR